jgi:hypothetical protein
MIFFLHETTIHKMLVADWKTFKIFGNLGKFCAATSPPMHLVFFSDFQKIWIHYWKRKKYLYFSTRFCCLRFVIWFFFKSWIPQIYQTGLLRWMKTRKGLTFSCYKNELGHKQLLLIVFGIRNYRLPIYPSVHPSFLIAGCKSDRKIFSHVSKILWDQSIKKPPFSIKRITVFFAVNNGL